MACPHVSGAVAQYLQLNPSALPQEVGSQCPDHLYDCLLWLLNRPKATFVQIAIKPINGHVL